MSLVTGHTYLFCLEITDPLSPSSIGLNLISIKSLNLIGAPLMGHLIFSSYQRKICCLKSDNESVCGKNELKC